MRVTLVLGLVPAMVLAGCSSGLVGANAGRGDDHPQVCQEQHELAKLGKRPDGEIAISCPAHGIGYAYE